jgi:hypothetical protein
MVTESMLARAERFLDRCLEVRESEEEIGAAWEAYTRMFAQYCREHSIRRALQQEVGREEA